jgi:hypothetical protein
MATPTTPTTIHGQKRQHKKEREIAQLTACWAQCEMGENSIRREASCSRMDGNGWVVKGWAIDSRNRPMDGDGFAVDG